MEELWPLSSRVEAWNLFLDVAKSMKFSLSPVVTSSFIFLHQIIFKNKIKIEDCGHDLISLCITSFLINVKAEGTDVNLRSIIQEFAKFSGNFSADQQKILGQDTVSKLIAVNNGNKGHLERIYSLILRLEPEMLALSGWEFVTDHPFAPLIYWLKKLRQNVPEDKLEEHRKMRGSAVNYLCALIIACEGPYPAGRVIAGAALTFALYNFQSVHPGVTHENWYTELNYVGYEHAQEQDIPHIIEISHMIPPILDKINHIIHVE